MYVAEIYSKVIDLFQDKNRFLQGYFQVNKEGKVCSWREGYCFCVLGALGHFTWPFNLTSYESQCCLQRVSEHLYGNGTMGSCPIQSVNDGPDGYEKVIKALTFAKVLWQDREPSEDDLSKPVTSLPWFEHCNELQVR